MLKEELDRQDRVKSKFLHAFGWHHHCWIDHSFSAGNPLDAIVRLRRALFRFIDRDTYAYRKRLIVILDLLNDEASEATPREQRAQWRSGSRRRRGPFGLRNPNSIEEVKAEIEWVLCTEESTTSNRIIDELTACCHGDR